MAAVNYAKILIKWTKKMAVSIDTKNPGAMWPGPVATKFGSTKWIPCGGNNRCAVFPTFEQGGAAQFYLWAHNYSGMSLRDAIKKWSGGNSSPEYAAFLSRKLPGITLDTIINQSFLAGPNGISFMKAQAQWEAGQPYPMTDSQWARAQAIAFGTTAPVPDIPEPKTPVSFWQELLQAIISILTQLFRRK